MTVRLADIQIENFRGFAERKTIPLDADVVLVSGGNGTGKTSLTDAITWCLTGELPGLAQRLKGERKGEDYVLSRYGSGPAQVRLVLRDDDATWAIERRGGVGESELTLTPPVQVPSEAARHLAQIFDFEQQQALTDAVFAWGVLRQDSMRATLDAGSESLHRKLREILGLGALAEFEAATREASQQLSDQAAAARQELDQLETRMRVTRSELDAATAQESSREVARAAASARLDRLRTQPVAGMRLVLPAQARSGDVEELGVQISTLAGAALDVSQQLAAAPAQEDAFDDEMIAVLADVLRRAEKDLAAAEAHHSAQVRMAEAALGLLSEHCPVCTQSIDEQHVRAHLERLLGGDLEDAADLEEARERVSASRSALDNAESAARRAVAARAAREQAAAHWTRALAGASLLDVPQSWLSLEALQEALSALQSARDELRAAYRELLALEHDPALAGLTAQLAELDSAQAAARERAESTARRAQQADGLRKAATASAVEITEQGLTALEPAFAEVYDRLAPHPSFTHLRMVHETYYGKGRSTPRIYDPVRGIEANPNLVCSEGQLNIVALSYFLALNLEREDGGLPFAILDDPLQAMDVINVLGFCDVARALRERRQLILTTHDRRFAALLERKLTPRRWGQRTLHLQFNAWDRSGPRIEVGRPTFEDIPSLLNAA